MILVFLGPPGSGKGTQAKTLAEKLKVPHISLGDILREEVRRGTEFGRRAKELMEAGKLVPDELTIALTRQRIVAADCRPGFIVDGFPRSPVQAEAFDAMMSELKRELSAVIYFKVPQAAVIERLSGRRSCKQCGAVYHVKSLPPKVAGRCDRDGGELYLRPDDEPGVIQTRFEVYERQTRPLIDHYAAMGKLVEINAAQDVPEVFSALLKVPAVAAAL